MIKDLSNNSLLSYDVIAEHDYFKNLQSKHFEELTHQENERKKRQREKDKEASLAWRKEGDQALLNVKDKVHDIRVLLNPYHFLKSALQKLLELRDLTIPTYSIVSKYSYPILINGNNEKFPRKYFIKTNLIMHKYLLQQQLLFESSLKTQIKDLSQPIEHYLQYKSRPPLTSARFLYRYYLQFIPIEKQKRDLLYKKRRLYKKAKDKLDLIHKTQEACNYILSGCKSIQHYNMKGCSNCGVIYMGGQLDGATPYVKSLSRDTGVPTLVTLDFEFETLAKEEVIQIKIVDELFEDLTQFESIVVSQALLAIQHWWRFVLSYKRLFKKHMGLIKSKFYYRIRRLSKLKREIDTLIKEPDIMIYNNYLTNKYCDLLPEYQEHLHVQIELKHQRILRISQRLKKKIQVIVEEARERRYQEWLRLQSLPPPVKPIRIKNVPNTSIQESSFICFRPECKMRKFLSQDRYQTHMLIHQKEDYQKEVKYLRNREMKQMRFEQETEFLNYVKTSRDFIISELLDLSSETKSNSILTSIDRSSLYTEEISKFLQVNPVQTLISMDSSQTNTDKLPPISSPKIISYKPLNWTKMNHQFNLFDIYQGKLSFYLELVSKHSCVEAKSKFLLNYTFIRLGTHDCCECQIKLLGELEKLGKVSKIHCLIFRNPEDNSMTIVDNFSPYGSYIVNETGAQKIPNKISKGINIANGSLICIGVQKDGPPTLSTLEASNAALVYRLQCIESAEQLL